MRLLLFLMIKTRYTVFADAVKITKFAKLKDSINSYYVALSNHGDSSSENHKCVIFIIIKHLPYIVMCSDNVLM